MTFTLLADRFVIVRLSPANEMPAWAVGGSFVSITRTADELSIVCPEDAAPGDIQADRGWRCLKVSGPVPLDATGVAAEFSSILARAGVSVFIVATYDTDYLLVKSEQLQTAAEALRRAGHTI